MIRQRSRKIAFLALVFILFAFCAHAGEVLTASPSWKGFTSPDGQGLYPDLMRAVFQLRGDTVRHLDVPAKRGLIMVREGQADIYTCKAESVAGLQLAQLPMYEGEYHALFLTKEVPQWSGPASMSNKRLVWRLGYYAPKDFPVPIEYGETTTGTDALKRVLRGAADFYVDDLHLIMETVRSYPAAIDEKDYRIESVGFRQYFPVFSLSERGNELREAFEQGMRMLAEQGKLRPIYDKWGLPMPRVYQK